MYNIFNKINQGGIILQDQSEVRNFSLWGYFFGKRDRQRVSEESILSVIDESSKEGIIDTTSKDMIKGILEFDDKVASEIMTPRTKVVAININMSIEEITEIILNTPFSRLPVYNKDIHQINGVLHVQDFFKHIYKQSNVNLNSIIDKPYIIPETKSLKKVLKEMQQTRNHMAIILDEYGDFSGLISIEDILEEIVGDISDDVDQDNIIKNEDGSYLVDGLVHIDDLNKKLNINIECEHYDTIGGFIIQLLGEIPKEIVAVSYKDWVLEIKSLKKIE